MVEHEPPIPSFTLTADDPAAPFALLAYASGVRNRGGSDEEVAAIRDIVQDWYRWQDAHSVIPLGRSVMLNKKVEQVLAPKEADDAE